MKWTGLKIILPAILLLKPSECSVEFLVGDEFGRTDNWQPDLVPANTTRISSWYDDLSTNDTLTMLENYKDLEDISCRLCDFPTFETGLIPENLSKLEIWSNKSLEFGTASIPAAMKDLSLECDNLELAIDSFTANETLEKVFIICTSSANLFEAIKGQTAIQMMFVECGQESLVVQNFTKLWNVYFSKNNVTILTNTTFLGSYEITELNLNSNHIEVIEEDTFKDLAKLQYLNLDQNNFKHLEVVFNIMSDVDSLRLSTTESPVEVLDLSKSVSLPELEYNIEDSNLNTFSIPNGTKTMLGIGRINITHELFQQILELPNPNYLTLWSVDGLNGFNYGNVTNSGVLSITMKECDITEVNPNALLQALPQLQTILLERNPMTCEKLASGILYRQSDNKLYIMFGDREISCANID